jgi:hypothetical protein
MTPERARRIAIGLWLLLAVVAWNALYDLRISLGVRDVLIARSLHEAGRGPAVALADAMRGTVRDAVFVATLWAAILLAAGLWTVRLLARTRPPA